MTPSALRSFLDGLVRGDVRWSVMIWGPPGIGKSSVVSQVATAQGISLIDLRLSQLAPTDLRGLPIPVDGVTRWAPPEFLPREGRGILFLDEINLAPPALQGVAQQLVLDRRVGSYTVPDGWFVWAAGNRKEDHASVFDMPRPLSNRFLHLEVGVDLEAFRAHAVSRGVHERIVAFLSYRPSLLHRIDPQRPAWPSPRSWEMADALLRAELDITPAVGAPAAGEFEAFCKVYASLPDIAAILRGEDVSAPDEASARYATTLALALRCDGPGAVHALRWVHRAYAAEWVQLFLHAALEQLRAKGAIGPLAAAIARDKELTAAQAALQRMLRS